MRRMEIRWRRDVWPARHWLLPISRTLHSKYVSCLCRCKRWTTRGKHGLQKANQMRSCKRCGCHRFKRKIRKAMNCCTINLFTALQCVTGRSKHYGENTFPLSLMHSLGMLWQAPAYITAGVGHGTTRSLRSTQPKWMRRSKPRTLSRNIIRAPHWKIRRIPTNWRCIDKEFSCPWHTNSNVRKRQSCGGTCHRLQCRWKAGIVHHGTRTGRVEAKWAADYCKGIGRWSVCGTWLKTKELMQISSARAKDGLLCRAIGRCCSFQAIETSVTTNISVTIFFSYMLIALSKDSKWCKICSLRSLASAIDPTLTSWIFHLWMMTMLWLFCERRWHRLHRRPGHHPSHYGKPDVIDQCGRSMKNATVENSSGLQ